MNYDAYIKGTYQFAWLTPNKKLKGKVLQCMREYVPKNLPHFCGLFPVSVIIINMIKMGYDDVCWFDLLCMNGLTFLGIKMEVGPDPSEKSNQFVLLLVKAS